jgi:Reverse transcriptase (RNA-dependent DNA polymerase)
LSKELADLLDLKLAWTRVKDDSANRTFIINPYSAPLIDFDLDNWLKNRLKAITADSYSPSPMFVCDVPKENGLIRPGSHLSTLDRLVYAACVGACFGAIQSMLAWSQGKIDYSYMLAFDSEDPKWTRDRFVGWKSFDEESLRYIDAGLPYVITADISTFYESIDIGILLSDIRATGAPEPAIKQLSICLNRWAQVPGRGIPQGQSPSDILAKLYLNSIDQNLVNMGYTHLRYVDDIRVFCTSLVEAKQLLVDLSHLLRRRGLSLQSTKSEILSADKARHKIQAVTQTLNEIRKQYIQGVMETTGLGDPYMDLGEADQILEASSVDTPIEIIREAYQKYFIDGAGEFNKTLFRFLLNRLAKQSDTFAGDHALNLLEPHPEETQTILKYLACAYPMESLDSPLVQLVRSGQLPYSYQIYQIVSWFRDNSTDPFEEVVNLCRNICFDPKSPRYLRTVCRAFLGDHGTNADLERIASSYDVAETAEHVEIICSIRRLEKGRRNALLARFEDDGEMNRLAVRWVKSA